MVDRGIAAAVHAEPGIQTRPFENPLRCENREASARTPASNPERPGADPSRRGRSSWQSHSSRTEGSSSDGAAGKRRGFPRWARSPRVFVTGGEKNAGGHPRIPSRVPSSGGPSARGSRRAIGPRRRDPDLPGGPVPGHLLQPPASRARPRWRSSRGTRAWGRCPRD